MLPEILCRAGDDVLGARFDQAVDSCHDVRVVFNVGEQAHFIYFHSDDIPLGESPEALVTAGLLPAMRTGLDLKVDSVLDSVFSSNLDAVQNLFLGWDASFRQVRVLSGGDPLERSGLKGHRVGLFFSGGVDSFYTLLEHRDEITDLIFVHGFDIQPDDLESCKRAEQSIRRVGEPFGKRVVVVKTDLRMMLDDYAGWGGRTHGAAMATVAHLLPGDFESIYIAASDSYGFISPWGSHPEMDPLWSRSSLEFIHDGCDATRLEKMKRIVLSDTALQNLRVCWKNRKGALNCGRCEKCIRTLIGLKIIGAPDCSAIFGKSLRAWRVLGVKIPRPDFAVEQLDNLAALKKEPKHRLLYWALSAAFFRSRLRDRFKSWRRSHGG